MTQITFGRVYLLRIICSINNIPFSLCDDLNVSMLFEKLVSTEILKLATLRNELSQSGICANFYSINIIPFIGCIDKTVQVNNHASRRIDIQTRPFTLLSKLLSSRVDISNYPPQTMTSKIDKPKVHIILWRSSLPMRVQRSSSWMCD